MSGRGHRLRHLRGGGQAAEQRVEDPVMERSKSETQRGFKTKHRPGIGSNVQPASFYYPSMQRPTKPH